MGEDVDIDLSTMDLGAPAAERDVGLEHYFIKSETYRRVTGKSKTVILGNRGSGKSAIFKTVAQEAKLRGAIAIELSPDDYSYELLKSTLAAESQGSWAKTGAYSASWKYMIYVLVMQHLAAASPKKSSSKTPIGRISRYINDNYPAGSTSRLQALVSYLKRLEVVKIGPFETSRRAERLHSLYRLEEINSLMSDIKSILESKEVLVFVDELDKGWDGGEDAQAFVAGLFQACVTINSLSKNLTVYMSLRQELYDNIPSLYEDAQKYRDLIETVSWNEEGLRGVIGARMRYAVKALEGQDDVACWNYLFAETLNYRQNKSFNYVVDRTLYRPRELIQFTSQAVDSALKGNSAAPLDYSVISQAEVVYSGDRTQDIAAEYRFQYPGLLSVFEVFRGRQHTLDRSELELLCMELALGDIPISEEAYDWVGNEDSAKLIEILWRVGFLRAQAVGGVLAQRRSGSSYLGPHQVSHLNLVSLQRFQVHPMFRAFLGMKEPKGTKGSPADQQYSINTST